VPRNRPQLHQPRIGEIVARTLRDRILDGALPDGAAPPRQEDLMREFGVSRPSLREALRELETEGLISVRRGNVGGAVVQLPNATSVAYMLGLALQSEKVAIDDVSSALLHLEPVCAALCAEREDRADTAVPALRAVHQEMVDAIDGDDEEFTVAASRFHEALVENCGSVSLIWVVGALETVWSAHAERIAHERAIQERPTEGARTPDRKYGVKAHEKIIAMIEAGDARGTAALVREHLAHGQQVPLSEQPKFPVSASLIREPRLSTSFDQRSSTRHEHRH
jgi:DNA-binding FadR family transcriptional regulator